MKKGISFDAYMQLSSEQKKAHPYTEKLEKGFCHVDLRRPTKLECEMKHDGYVWGLRISYNGYQWTALEIRGIDDAKKIIAELKKWVGQQKATGAKPHVYGGWHLCERCLQPVGNGKTCNCQTKRSNHGN